MIGADMRKFTYGFFSLSCLILCLGCSVVQAADVQAQELHQKLQQRDQVILELLERVEILENELGIKPARTRSSVSSAEENNERQIENTSTAEIPGKIVVDDSTAARALERSLTRDGVLLLPSGVLEIETRLAYTRQEDATPGFVMSGGSVIASETERNSDSLTAALLWRLGLPADAQLEVGLPYRWRRTETVTSVGFTPVQTSTQYGNGLGDLRVTYAKTVSREDAHYPDVIGRLTWDTDSGELSDDGVPLGGGFHEVQAGLSFLRREDPVIFVGSIAYEYTFEESDIQPGASIAASLGSYIALSPQTSLSLQVAIAYEAETRIAGVAVDGSDRKFGSLIIGGSTLIGRSSLLNFSVGVGLTDDADDFSISVSVPVRLDSRLF